MKHWWKLMHHQVARDDVPIKPQRVASVFRISSERCDYLNRLWNDHLLEKQTSHLAEALVKGGGKIALTLFRDKLDELIQERANN